VKPDSGHWDLKRWQPSEAPELQRALDAAKQQLPDAAQLSALAASLSQMGIPVAAPAHAAAAPGSSATRLKLLLGAAMVGPLALSVLLARSSPSPSITGSALAAAPAPSAPLGVSGASAPTATSGLRPPTAAPAIAASSRPEALSVPPGASSLLSAERDETGSPAPIMNPSVAKLAPAAAMAKASSEVARPSHSSDRVTTESVGSAVVSKPTEVALLRDAQLALRANPAEALALTEQHRALFARGAMIQERELIAISALARLGRHTAVLARAAEFERDFPGSPYRKQVSALAR